MGGVAWNFTKWAQEGIQRGGTGFLIGGFVRNTKMLFDKLDGTRQNKIIQFRALCEQIFRRIVERTPVDTGLAKSGWKLEFTKDDKYGVRAAITNGVFYVVYLEYGHSQQAPQGMLRITLSEAAQGIRELWGL